MPKGQTRTTEQIIKALRLVDEGVRVGDVCRQLSNRREDVLLLARKVRRMEVGEAKRLRELEDGNARLKKLLTEQMLHDEALKDVL